MINKVNVEQERLKELFLEGYVLEYKRNALTIRDVEERTVTEIMYFEKTDEILIMGKSRFVWCKAITDIIAIDDTAIVICYEVDEIKKYKTIALYN